MKSEARLLSYVGSDCIHTQACKHKLFVEPGSHYREPKESSTTFAFFRHINLVQPCVLRHYIYTFGFVGFTL